MTARRHTWRDHSGDAGFVFQSKRTGATVYIAKEQADPSDGKYVIICPHSRLVNVSSKRDAQFVAGSALNLADLCPACRAGDFNERRLTESEDRE